MKMRIRKNTLHVSRRTEHRRDRPDDAYPTAVLLNAVNFGYSFFTITILRQRRAWAWSIPSWRRHAVGHRTAGDGPANNALSSSFLTYEDMRGALNAPTANASVSISASAGNRKPGTTTAKAACNTYPGTGVTFTFLWPKSILN